MTPWRLLTPQPKAARIRLVLQEAPEPLTLDAIATACGAHKHTIRSAAARFQIVLPKDDPVQRKTIQRNAAQKRLSQSRRR